jgi:hypothetical protein
MSKKNRTPAPVVAESVDAPATTEATVAEVTTETPPVAEQVASGRKIEANREEKNGVKRPSAGGLCRAVWDFCDERRASTGAAPTVADVKLEATARGWNSNNASIEYYQWRKFEGIRGRQAKPAAPAEAPKVDA